MSRKVAAMGKVMSHDIWKGSSSLKGFETCNKRDKERKSQGGDDRWKGTWMLGGWCHSLIVYAFKL